MNRITKTLIAASAVLALAAGVAVAQQGQGPQGMGPQGMMGGGPMGMMMGGPGGGRGPMLADTDKDGVITDGEWTTFHAQLFQQHDVNKDGKLTQDEFGPGMGRRMQQQQQQQPKQ